MLAHLKGKRRELMPPEAEDNNKAPPVVTQPSVTSNGPSAMTEDKSAVQQVTCDALCSLGSTSPQPCAGSGDDSPPESVNGTEKGRKAGKACPKQHQLPMFLSKTYHMIDRCDPSIATWSATGDNFVVKNVEKFAGTVLPQYFKHSNFSSFARQLNFYGFRKLKAEPILTADFDARTACYVRFYHEKFQKDRPELLSHIKRATKSDQQSKDDVESLRVEICKLKECMSTMSAEYDRKIAEVHFEYNRRINNLSADYDKLAVLVQQLMASTGDRAGMAQASTNVPDMMHSLSQVAAYSLQTLRPPATQPVPPVAATAGQKRRIEEEETKPTSRAKKS